MNLYILVEGEETELQLYPQWLSYLIPELSRVYDYRNVNGNNYYLFSGRGIPSIYRHAANAIRDINTLNSYDYLIVCMDSDELTVERRKEKLLEYLAKENVSIHENCNLKVIIQNRCIETWFLGNRKVYKRNPQGLTFKEYAQFYNVAKRDPELMTKHQDFKQISQFHEAYLREMLKEYRVKYRKSRPKEVLKRTYFDELLKRVSESPRDLQSFSNFLALCGEIKHKIQTD